MTKQYTIRNIPEGVDRVLRKKAKSSGKNFNQVALEALITGTGEPLALQTSMSRLSRTAK